MKIIFKNLLLCSLSFATFQLIAQKKTADLVVYNALVYTVDNQFAKAEAFAIKGRHDLCIALRVPPVLDSVSACVIADALLMAQ